MQNRKLIVDGLKVSILNFLIVLYHRGVGPPWLDLVWCIMPLLEPKHQLEAQLLEEYTWNLRQILDHITRYLWHFAHNSTMLSRGVFQLEMVKIVLTSHFHKKVRATIGLVPTSQLPWWCYIENERTIWERNGLIETPTLRGIIAKWLREKG